MSRGNREENSWYTRLPLLPLKDVVIFPRMVVPLMVGRPASMSAVEESLATDRPLFVCTQKDPSAEVPTQEGLHSVGVAANILQTVRMPDNTLKIVIEGLYRAVVRRMTSREGYYEVAVEEIQSKPTRDKKGMALMRTTLNQFEEYVRLSQRVAPEIVLSLRNITESEPLLDILPLQGMGLTAGQGR